MSIVGLLAQSSRPALEPSPQMAAAILLLLIALSIISPWLALRLGVQRPQNVDGPVRHTRADSFWLFVLILAGAVVIQSLGAVMLTPLMAGMPDRQRRLAAVMLATSLGFVLIVAANHRVRPDGTRSIGLLPQNARPGLSAGAAGLLIVLPWLFWLMMGAYLLLEQLGIRPDTEHDVFRLWQQNETTAAFRIISVFAAVILAPLAEETFFRGILQTAMVKLFSDWLGRNVPPASATTGPVIPVAGSLPPQETSPPATVPRAARWLAILATSLLFALIHRPWFIQPPIFLLSLGLGYVYERTGNLWSAIFMHMLFNGVQFGIFLLAYAR